MPLKFQRIFPSQDILLLWSVLKLRLSLLAFINFLKKSIFLSILIKSNSNFHQPASSANPFCTEICSFCIYNSCLQYTQRRVVLWLCPSWSSHIRRGLVRFRFSDVELLRNPLFRPRFHAVAMLQTEKEVGVFQLELDTVSAENCDLQEKIKTQQTEIAEMR